MKVSMNIYGKQAEVLARELGLACNNLTTSTDVQMAAHFTIRDVAGHTVVAAEFTTTEPEQADCTGNEERQENFMRAERRFDVSREARGY